jgi:hypothetical protein
MQVRDLLETHVGNILVDRFIAVPRATIWQRDIHGIWRFRTRQEAEDNVDNPELLRDSRIGSGRGEDGRAVAVTTMNGLHLLMHVSASAANVFDLPHFRVLAYTPTLKSAQEVGLANMAKLMAQFPDANYFTSSVWAYKTWNNQLPDKEET